MNLRLLELILNFQILQIFYSKQKPTDIDLATLVVLEKISCNVCRKTFLKAFKIVFSLLLYDLIFTIPLKFTLAEWLKSFYKSLGSSIGYVSLFSNFFSFLQWGFAHQTVLFYIWDRVFKRMNQVKLLWKTAFKKFTVKDNL